MTGGAAGRVLLGGQDHGSGFAITERRALTAGHVVRDAAAMAGSQRGPAAAPPGSVLEFVVDGGGPTAAPAVVQYQPEGGEPIPVTRVEVRTNLDVAVLHLQRPAPAFLPVAKLVAAGAQWRVETRPGARDSYTLTGTVTDPRRRRQNEAGKETTLVQLSVREELGDYQGYSGSPVIAVGAGELAGGVLGVLVEQGFKRMSPELGQRRPVANVLFAAPIGQVLAEFDLPGVARPVAKIPMAVSYEVSRPELLNQVMDALTAPSPEARLVGLAGMGGAGKSVLAAAAARDQKIREAFPDGQFWLDLGPDPRLLQASLAAALGDSTPFTNVPQGRARLSRLLAERRCLLVLDNVGDQAHLSAFTVTGKEGRVLATTRDAAALLPGATVIALGELAPQSAMELLANWAETVPGNLPEEAAQVARECGYLPLALALCGAMISDHSHSWPQLLGLLRETNLDEFRRQLDDYPHPSLAVALGASLGTLDPDARDRYLRLAVFDGQGPIPPATLQMLWALDQEHTGAFIGDLAGKSLLRRAGDGRVSLHDLQMDYLVRLAPDLPALHNRLLTAYRGKCPGGWAAGPDDGYFHEHLAHHLQQAGRAQEFRALLLNPDWMSARLAAGTIPGLLADYDSFPTDPALHLVDGALRLSVHVLSGDPGQLPGQLTGRLTGQADPRLRDLLQRTRQWPAPWLRPLTASLIPPGGPLRLTLTGHDGPVGAVAVSADGRRAVSGGGGVSGGDDGPVRVWDLEAGELRYTLTGHVGPVWAVAVSPDGRRAVSGGLDGPVRVWDLQAGTLLRTLTGHDASMLKEDVEVGVGELRRPLLDQDEPVRAVAVSADGQRAISGGREGTVRVWDVATGKRIASASKRPKFWPFRPRSQKRLAVVVSGVRSLSIGADGRRAVSGGGDETVRVWDLEAGTLLHTLTGHDRRVWAVAVSADGRRAVSGGGDKTVRVWDLEAGVLLHTLTGHQGPVVAVAVSADGRRAVSSGGDKTVRVWDLAQGAELASFASDNLIAVMAATPPGVRVVAGTHGGPVHLLELCGYQLP